MVCSEPAGRGLWGRLELGPRLPGTTALLTRTPGAQDHLGALGRRGSCTATHWSFMESLLSSDHPPGQGPRLWGGPVDKGGVVLPGEFTVGLGG